MRIGALSLFKRTSSTRTYNIASWHRYKSLTWRWIFSLDTNIRSWERKAPYYMKLNGGCMWGFYIPFMGKFSYQSQASMFNATFTNRGRSEIKQEQKL